MKKKIILISMFFPLVILATIGTKIANSNKMSAVGLIFANMEALASDTENEGSKGQDCTFGREQVSYTSTAYECHNAGRTLCTPWKGWKNSGDPRGYCTNFK